MLSHTHVTTDNLVQMYMGSMPHAYASRKVRKGAVCYAYTQIDREAEKQ